jgi:hypothetical protein
MRYQLRVSRVQTAERSVSATDPEAAIEKIRAEIEKPYGFLGGWKTEGYEVEVLSAESRLDGSPSAVGDSPMLFSIKAAAEHSGFRGHRCTSLCVLVRSNTSVSVDASSSVVPHSIDSLRPTPVRATRASRGRRPTKKAAPRTFRRPLSPIPIQVNWRARRDSNPQPSDP